jgi:hypothetical protein
MLERRLWTEEEVRRLKHLYLSGRPFEEVAGAFPKRTTNAIRQKASRLGLRRPPVSHSLLLPQSVLRCSDGNGEDDDYLFKCGACGSWIHVSLIDDVDDRTIVCRKCQTVSKYVA